MLYNGEFYGSEMGASITLHVVCGYWSKIVGMVPKRRSRYHSITIIIIIIYFKKNKSFKKGPRSNVRHNCNFSVVWAQRSSFQTPVPSPLKPAIFSLLWPPSLVLSLPSIFTSWCRFPNICKFHMFTSLHF